MKRKLCKVAILFCTLCLSTSFLFACNKEIIGLDETQDNRNLVVENQNNTKLVDKVQERNTNFDITIVCSEGGTVENTSFSVTPGTEIALQATPDNGYFFTGWYENDSCFSLEESCGYDVWATTTITAQFAQIPKKSAEDLIKESEEQDLIITANGFELDTATNGLRYAYFVPTLQEDTSYPLVIYLHGKFHGFTDQSFTDNGLVYWTREDMQGLFPEGGAYLWMPKLDEAAISSSQGQVVMQGLEEFIGKNKTIDTKRIYIMGGSAGGGLTWNMIT